MKSFTANFAKLESYSAEIWGIETGLSAAAGSIISKIKFSLLNQKF